MQSSSTKPPPLLSRAGAAPGSLGLSGSAGLQLKAPAKKFGLQPPPGKKPVARPAAASVFGGGDDDDDDLGDDASERARVSRELMRGSTSTFGRAAAEAAQKAALEQDASIFDYDDAYDAMQQERVVAKEKPKQEKSAKYIGALMQAHKVREIENEKVFERKMVKEAEEEAHLYADKERFLTSAYRAKLAAREEYEAELAKQDAEDAKNDVTQKRDLSGFYSNLLSNSLAPDRAVAAARGTVAASVTTADSVRSLPPRPPRPPSELDASHPPAQLSRPAEEAASAAPVSAPPPSASRRLVDDDLVRAIAEAAKAAATTAPPAPAPAPAATAVSHERRNDADAVQSARERYLERKRQRE